MFFFFNDTATTEIYTLSLHDALPIFRGEAHARQPLERGAIGGGALGGRGRRPEVGVVVLQLVVVPHVRHGMHAVRSEEHTSELQSRQYLVCRLLLEKKKTPRKRK